MSNEMLPQYSTELFVDIWDDVADFKSDLAASPFAGCISTSNPDNVSVVFYLLYARYGNNPIANQDINQWKFKIFSVIFQYGPTWEKRLDLQSKIRSLTDDELLTGSTPFLGKTYDEVFKNIKKGTYNLPKNLKPSIEIISFLNGLLQYYPEKRLTWKEINAHPFLNKNPNEFLFNN